MTNAVANSFFTYAPAHAVSFEIADASFEIFRAAGVGKEKSAPAGAISGEEHLPDKHHLLPVVQAAVYTVVLQKLDNLTEEEIPDDFQEKLPSKATIYTHWQQRKRGRSSSGGVRPAIVREWRGLQLNFEVDQETKTLTIPQASYNDPTCPAAMRTLRSLCPEVMVSRPCDSKVFIVPLTSHYSPAVQFGFVSSNFNSGENFVPVAIILHCWYLRMHGLGAWPPGSWQVRDISWLAY